MSVLPGRMPISMLWTALWCFLGPCWPGGFRSAPARGLSHCNPPLRQRPWPRVAVGCCKGAWLDGADATAIECAEGSVRQVAGFQMGRVRTSILGDLDPYPRPLTPRSAHPH